MLPLDGLVNAPSGEGEGKEVTHFAPQLFRRSNHDIPDGKSEWLVCYADLRTAVGAMFRPWTLPTLV